MELKFLHLSDIHFQHLGVNEHLDYFDDDVRNELELDLEIVVKNIGSIDAILISGDIAFSSKEEQYNKAALWLKKICTICDCLEENVLTVPGNHDINRDIGALILSAHSKFKELRNRNKIDSELFEYLKHDEDYLSLLKPLSNYTKFAQKYCVLPDKNTFYWEKNFSLVDTILRIRGLNSTIISNAKDDEHTSKLILGGHQTTLKREKGVVYLTLCHHPPQWLYDIDEVESDLNTRAKIQLYGHKHVFQATRINDTLKLSAGAVHPEKDETGWQPRYNIIGLSVIQKEKKYLKVKLWERIWNNDKKFIAKYNETCEEYCIFELPLNELESQPVLKQETNMEIREKDTLIDDVELINLVTPDPKRKLAYMFFDLPFHYRIKIASLLNLIEDTDENTSAIQQSQNVLKKAVEQNKLDDLWEQVALFKPELKKTINPFKI